MTMDSTLLWWRTTLLQSGALLGIFSALLVAGAVLTLRALLLRLVLRRYEDPALRYQWRKTSGYVAALLLVLLIAPTLVGGLRNIATYLGLLTAGLAIALQEMVLNLAGWFFIIWRRPFWVGDRVQIGACAGDVIDIRLFEFTLMEIGNWVSADQSTGRIINVPNGRIFHEALANYSSGHPYIWNEIPVQLTYESDWRKAKERLQAIAERNGACLDAAAQQRLALSSDRYNLIPGRLTPTVYTSVTGSGVLLTMRYLCEPRQRRDSAQAIWEDVLTLVHEDADIQLAYPTSRAYRHPSER